MLPTAWFCEYLHTFFSSGKGWRISCKGLPYSHYRIGGIKPKWLQSSTVKAFDRADAAGKFWKQVINLCTAVAVPCETGEGRLVSLLHLLLRFLRNLTLQTYVRETYLP